MNDISKQCTKCQSIQSLDNFCDKPRGLYGKDSICKNCRSTAFKAKYLADSTTFKQRAFDAQRQYQTINSAYIQSVKTKCELCLRDLPAICLDFDHLDPSTKRWNVSSKCCLVPLDTLKEEIAKCRVICSNCHRLETFKNRSIKGCKKSPRRLSNEAYVQNIKSKPCVDCGLAYHYSCMDFDHLRDKTRVVGQMMGYSLDIIKAEIAKCELVCSNCHRLRHQGNTIDSI